MTVAPSPSPPSTETSLLKKPLGWIVLAVCGAILCSRRPDLMMTPQFWAEDGFFFQMNLEHGLAAFTESYAGYLHTVPRLIAAVCGLLDYAWIPAGYVVSCLIFMLWIAGLTLSDRFPLRPRIACALAVALLPDIPDGLFTPTNLQSILAGGFIALLLFKDPRTTGEYFHDIALVVLFGLTGPFSVMMTPFFIARAYLRRTRASGLLAAIVALCGCIQLWFIITQPLPRTEPYHPIEWAYFLAIPGSRLFASLFWIRYQEPDKAVWLLNILGVITIIGVPLLCWRKQTLRIERTLLVVATFALLAAGMYRIHEHLFFLARIGYGSRYFYAPQLTVLWLLIQAQHDHDRLTGYYRALLVWFLVMNVPRLREPSQPDLHWENYVGALQRGRAVTIPINPQGWTIPVPRHAPRP